MYHASSALNMNFIKLTYKMEFSSVNLDFKITVNEIEYKLNQLNCDLFLIYHPLGLINTTK